MPENPSMLPRDAFERIVRDAPLVSIDLIVRTPDQRILLGLRTNEPARGAWFVPGGRVRKDEKLAAAFERITETELGRKHSRDHSRLVGVYEHLYDSNFAGRPGFGTHYVVLAHELDLDAVPPGLPEDQHAGYRWLAPEELLADPSVHDYTKDYFRG